MGRFAGDLGNFGEFWKVFVGFVVDFAVVVGEGA